MKIRLGFVTNSSSSNYVLGFKKLPESYAEIIAKYPEIEEFILKPEALVDKVYNSIDEFKEEYDDYDDTHTMKRAEKAFSDGLAVGELSVPSEEADYAYIELVESLLPSSEMILDEGY